MSHGVEEICRYGTLQQYSPKRHEQAHNPYLRDCWNASNHNLNYLQQVITFQCCILCIEIRELNLQALAQHLENSAASCTVLSSCVVVAAPMTSRSYMKYELMGPQNCRDGKHPYAIIKDFRGLLDNTQDATHRVAIYSGMPERFNHMSHNETYILDEQLHAMALCIYHHIKDQVEGLEGQRISQRCQCTRSQGWHRGDRQSDWV